MIALSRLKGFLLLVSIAAAGSLALPPAGAAAAEPPIWKLDSIVSSSTAAPGDIVTVYARAAVRKGVATLGSPVAVKVTLPEGLTVVEAHPWVEAPGDIFFDCSAIQAGTGDTCTGVGSGGQTQGGYGAIGLAVSVDPDASGVLTPEFEVSGGGVPVPVSTAARITVTGATPRFGFDAFDSKTIDSGGGVFTQAGGHPYETTAHVDFSTILNPYENKIGSGFPPLWQQEVDGPTSVEAPKDVDVDLPPGFVGNTLVSGVARCTSTDLLHTLNQENRPFCPPESQVGTVLLRAKALGGIVEQERLFNMVPTTGSPARFGFLVLGVPTFLDAHLRPTDYGISVKGHNLASVLSIAGTSVSFWGVPADPSHEYQRGCPGEIEPPRATCASSSPLAPILRNPTSCTAAGHGLAWSAHTDSWEHFGRLASSGLPDPADPNWSNASFETHENPGWPLPPSRWGAPRGTDGCAAVPFEPTFNAAPTTDVADSPSGLNLDIGVPQSCWDPDQTEAICQSDLKDSVVTLPRGMSVNPSSASGLGSCSTAQIGLGDSQAPTCPDDSKIGEARVDTPVLDHAITGGIYLARQRENKFGSVIALYLTLVDPSTGIVIKLAGNVETDPRSGQLTTSFNDNPQLPFSKLHVELFGGPRAALRTPPTCGTYTTTAALTPWARPGQPVTRGSSFEITNCPSSGFNPKLSAGTTNPLASAGSPFALRLSRDDGTQEISGLQVKLPKGLLGSINGIPYCPDATLASFAKEGTEPALGSGAEEIAAPKCPAASQLGIVTVGSGAGPTPFYTNKGRAFLAGPYKGAPLSLAVVTPAVAGPFDLGTVVVRNALRVDPETSQITTVSDPLPTILHGIPLDLRDIRVDLNRPNFIVNPTSCEPKSIDATLTSNAGASAQRSSHFQAANCDRLPFEPKVSMALTGSTHRGDFPALQATLVARARNEANVSRAAVTLPHSEFLAQSHIRTVCTRVQYAAGGGGGERCPKGSIYGHARALTPLLEAPLEGPVYLRSSSNPLPDLVISLRGQIQIDLVGRIDTNERTHGIRATFENVPDAFVAKFVLKMLGGKKGLLENSTDLCSGSHRATARLDAHNGKVLSIRPALEPKGCRGKARPHGKRQGRRGGH